jgi:CheY-like chemotaxis protein
MDAVGRLAGGVAHDFNNLLMVINGYTEVLLEQLEPGSAMHHKVQSIQQAADRAATLTRQLLAFSRKQLLELKVVDVNTVVGDMERLLRPLIGENIELVTRLSTETGHTRADASQLEQVIMNLVVNAKDAMPEGGKLTLQSSDVTVRPDLNEPRFIQPGRYAVISVSDTGHGMDKETQSRIFEPFFTTKEVGKGTGLGLATVLGIVEQHQGWIEVASQPGRGTAFRIYFPFRDDEFAFSPMKPAMAEIRGGTETILLVEDEAVVRALAKKVLRSKGYVVLEADRSETALELWRLHRAKIDLLLTDIIMPGTSSGRDLAEQLLLEKPGLKVIYSTGYSDEVLGQDFLATRRFNFLPKPYDPLKLARMVRNNLDE